MNAPQVILRIGSHAEKEYFEKLAKSLDAILFGGNLLEITPAATSSLLLSLRMKRGGLHLPFYLDPMTYGFGAYVDPDTHRKRIDLDALKSDQLKARGSKIRVRRIKESYVSLARELGGSFQSAVSTGVAVDPSVLDGAQRDAMCEQVLAYQLNRIPNLLRGDDFLARYADGCLPAAVFAPYFYIDEKWADAGISVAVDLAKRAAAQSPSVPVHAMVVASQSVLRSPAMVERLRRELPATGVSGAWLWFSGFDELEAPLDDLVTLRSLVSALGKSMRVYNLHGGYYSLLLSHDGLSGISHGVGYGERKEVAQVIGEAAPTVRFYLPAIAKRISVPEVQRCFDDLEIKTPRDFFDKVCGCTICRGVIGKDVDNFSSFGKMHRARPESKRDSQTPAAAKMCRFHFLINRMNERTMVAKLAPAERANHVIEQAKEWRALAPLVTHLGNCPGQGYIERWSKAVS